MIQTNLQLIRAVAIHAEQARCYTVAHRWADCQSFKKTTRTCHHDIARLKRNGSAQAHLAAAAITELLRRRDLWIRHKSDPTVNLF